LKFLVIVALFALLLLLLYSRVYPYLQALKKILTAARKMTDSGFTSNTTNRDVGKTDSRLVRCVGCGTWIPAARAMGTNSGSSVYCSRECMEKKSDRREKKLAG
jgi:hypothetical protein